MLTHTDVAGYHDRGFIVVPDVIDSQTVQRAKATIDEFVERSRGVEQHDDVFDLEPTHRADAPRVRRIKTPHLYHPLFRELAGMPQVVAILKSLLGPDIRLHNSKINLKAPRYGPPVEWHQDWAFYPHTNDDLLAVGVMLDDCTLENGALLGIPGSHRGPVHDHHSDGYFTGAIDPSMAQIDFSEAEPFTGTAGSMSFHHVRLVHGSAQNRSDLSRVLLLYEFAAADAWPLLGISDLASFDSRLIAGKPTIEPRLAGVPVRMPFPPAPRQGSIYENQTTLKNRYFDVVAPTATS